VVTQTAARQDRDCAPEQLEVSRLRPDEREALEERDDAELDVAEAIDLPVPATVPGLAERSAPECVAEQLERRSIFLRHVEGGGDLPLPAVVASRTTYEHEASFSESEPRQEAPELTRDRFDSEPFLLIVRTRHVVTTVHARSDGTVSSAGYSDVPAYSRLLQLPQSIVTAAVYRGLISVPRLSERSANTST
jgi:hypothetical protein